MIRVEPQPEPPDFHEKVRKPGLRALAELRGQPAEKRPGPKRKVEPELKSKHLPDFWTKSLDDLHKAYRGICAYLCVHIPHAVGSKTTDHFSPKCPKVSPELEDAYEWSNYRLACSLMNTRKGTKSVIDPFAIDGRWSMVRARPLHLGDQAQPRATRTASQTGAGHHRRPRAR